MQTIFVQVKCDLGRSYQVAQALVDVEGVSEVYSISGPYDLLAKCYITLTKSISVLKGTVLDKCGMLIKRPL